MPIRGWRVPSIRSLPSEQGRVRFAAHAVIAHRRVLAQRLMSPSLPFRVLLLAGPPASSALWAQPIARWGARLPARALELFDPPPADASVAGLAARVVAELRAEPGPVVLVAQGSAIPVALAAAAQAPVARLVLCNGPLGRLDPFLGALARAARMPRLLAATLLQPRVLSGWLASSAGLRRAVVNPYVMDRDTVVALLDPLVRTPAHRRALASFLASLPAAVARPPVLTVPTLMVWGDADPLYPASDVDNARPFLRDLTHVGVPGGQHLHVEERPWVLADAVTAWLTRGGTVT